MHADDTGLDLHPPTLAIEAERLVRRLAAAALVLSIGLAVPLVAPLRLTGLALAGELRRGGALTLPLAALLLCVAATEATLLLARARRQASQAPAEAAAVGRAARIPQAIMVTAIALPAAALAWTMRPVPMPPAVPPETGFTIASVAIATAFLLLIAERNLASVPPRTLPEAPALRALAFVATGVAFAAGLLEIAANLGLPATFTLGTILALLVTLIGLELSARALGRLFLPPPAAGAARAAVQSLTARLLSAGAQMEGGLGAPLRQHLGIDFSRSWALTYVRAAALPMLGAFLLLAWGLSGLALVPLDSRAIYERFGAPVRVLHPGLHLGLPWPLGTARAIEFGPVHEIGLSGTGGAIEKTAAEDPAPASADRLWEQAHPGEVELLIASAANGRESFQSVSADLRILYRTGLTDAAAIRAAYATAAPESFVRSAAGRVVADYFAARTLDEVLGADRDAMAETMRTRLQAALDQAASGLDAVAVIIEAVHPPAGAADAYHNVRAAEIAARTSVAVEHGAAATIYAQSRQYAFDQTSNANAAAAETIGAAKTARLRFAADKEAATAGGQSFLLERYFGALVAALGKAPKTIIDHRLNYPEAPVLDLRPLAPPGIGPAKEE
jgi:regulator of protease activity HflC (stomatin/prohibitin superfamily)